MTYVIRWASPARRAIEHGLPEAVAAAVWEFVRGPLAENPHRVGKPLLRELAGFWSARRGQYRVTYAIDDEHKVRRDHCHLTIAETSTTDGFSHLIAADAVELPRCTTTAPISGCR